MGEFKLSKAHQVIIDRVIQFVKENPELHLDEDNETVIPDSANYKIATGTENCSNCQHFSDNYCEVWDSKVDGNHISDAYEATKEKEDIQNQEDGVDMSELSSLYFTLGQVEENDNLIWKTILRTDKWDYRPGPDQSPVYDPLYVIKDKSDDPKNKISLEDIIDSFNSGAIEHVTVPLSHKNLVNENTGYVRKLKIEEDPAREGEYVLQAGIEFTDQQIRQKVKDSSIANTSAGLFFNYLKRKDGQRYPIALDHVALTNKPWLNGLKPFGMAEEAGEETEVKYFAISESNDQGEPDTNEGSETENQSRKIEENTNLSQTNQTDIKEEITMSEKNSLESLELSDEVRSQVKALLHAQDEELEKLRQDASEVDKLREEKRKDKVENRVRELGELGFSAHPGFLKTVRQILLADKGETAAIMLSEDAQEVKITVSDVVEKVIDALPKIDGKVNFGEQAENIIGDEKPPADTKDENKSVEERLAESEEFLYGEVRHAKTTK